jgi:glycosyltransferase involved in cell wall biosynthesis
MRVAINLLTDDPANPSGAHWFWTRIIPEMANLLNGEEEFRLLVSPRSRSVHQGYGSKVDYITFPWSNENPKMRTLTEHLYAPVRLPLAGVDVFSTLFSPIVRPAPGLVVHIKTMHAHTEPRAVRLVNRLYRQLSLPRTVKVADAVILNSESLRAEVHHYLDVDPAKVHLIPEAVDHDLFMPGDRDEAWDHVTRTYGVTKPFVLFVSSLWRYKNTAGLIRAFAAAKAELGDRQLVIVGPDRDREYVAELRTLAEELGIAGWSTARRDRAVLPLRRRVRLPVVQ